MVLTTSRGVTHLRSLCEVKKKSQYISHYLEYRNIAVISYSDVIVVILYMCWFRPVVKLVSGKRCSISSVLLCTSGVWVTVWKICCRLPFIFAFRQNKLGVSLLIIRTKTLPFWLDPVCPPRRTRCQTPPSRNRSDFLIIFLPEPGSFPFHFNQFGWILEKRKSRGRAGVCHATDSRVSSVAPRSRLQLLQSRSAPGGLWVIIGAVVI